ncbi:hypothetical protein [Succinivibrio dextrinosolvens]|uniref:Uncharacterized protein n=1 Tax=Succinivibrio dextrinosolvens TaxID=83771 RepID=A0A662ZBV2_9GAMM|nr:hypothetical protein [Succinivibrio dextrinosolvens]SFK37533.1 hypothetical protein SAMN04487865_10636 [Succinivibrio dextrinosolvens]
MTVTINNIDANKSYYLSSDGSIKEAGFGQKFKCFFNIGNARSKVSNLVLVVKHNLLLSSNLVRDENLDNKLQTLDLKSNLKGSDIQEVIKDFKAVNGEKLNKSKAKRITNNLVSKTIESLVKDGKVDSRATMALEIFLLNSLKSLSKKTLPMKQSGKNQIFDENKFSAEIKSKLFETTNLIKHVALNKVAGGKLSNFYIDYMGSRLYDSEGNRTAFKANELKDLEAAKKEYICSKLKSAQIDVNSEKTQKAVELLINKTKDNHALTDLAIYNSFACLINGQNQLRSLEQIEENIEGIKSNFREFDAVGDELHGMRKTGLRLMNFLEGKNYFPEGYITNLINMAKHVDLTPFKNLNAKSSIADLHKAMFNLNNAMSEAMLKAGSDEDFKNIQNDRNHFMATKDLFQTAVLLRLSPNERENVKKGLENVNFAKLQAIYSAYHNDKTLFSSLNRNESKLAATLIDDLSDSSSIFTRNLATLYGKESLNILEYEEQIEYDEDSFGVIESDLTNKAKEYASQRINEFVNSHFSGNLAEPVKTLVKNKLMSDTYSNLGNDEYAGDIAFNKAVNKEVSVMMNWKIMSGAKQLNNGDFADAVCYKDINRLINVSLPDNKKLTNNFETACDEIARFVLSDDSVEYKKLDKESFNKTNLVLSMLSQETSKALSGGISVALDLDGKEDTLVLFGDRDKSINSFEFSLEKSEGKIILKLDSNISAPNIYVKGEQLQCDHNKTHFHETLTYSISEQELSRLAKVDLSEFDDTEMKHAFDGRENYRGENQKNKMSKIDNLIRPEFKVASSTKVSISGVIEK